jgi:hypothetical protein
MGEDKPQSTSTPEDIDLVILLERAILYFRRFKWAYIVAIIAGISLGLLAYVSSPRVFKSRMVVHPVFLTNGEQMQIIDNWDELLKRREYKTLALAFNCDEVMLHKLVSLDATDILKVFTPSNPNGFYIDVKVKDNSILPELQKAIVHGLNNSEFVKEKVAVRRDNLRLMIDEVKQEIDKLDSTKSTVENIISSKEKNSSSIMIDVSGLNRQLIDMNEKLLGYREELKFVNGIYVLQGFNRFDIPVSISLKVMIVLGLILCLAITYIYTLFVYVNERMRKHAGKPGA